MHFPPHEGCAERKKPTLASCEKEILKVAGNSSDEFFLLKSCHHWQEKKIKEREKGTGPILGALFCLWLALFMELPPHPQSSAIRNSSSKWINEEFQEHVKILTPSPQTNYNRHNFSNCAESAFFLFSVLCHCFSCISWHGDLRRALLLQAPCAGRVVTAGESGAIST